MGEKNRRILVAAIAVTVLAAVFVSFGVPALTGPIPNVTLADLDQPVSEETGQQLLPVEVTPETVQSVIATLTRPESYSRTLTVTLYWGESGKGEQQVQIWADDGYVKTTVTSGSGVQHRLVGDGKLRLWYDGDTAWKEVPAGGHSADLAQHIPTYEDVLTVSRDQITEAAYVDRDGKRCVYVEVVRSDPAGADRYWIETATGLLAACESLEGEKVVYSMEETAFASPLEDASVFTLPDGTMPSAIQQEGGG